VQPNFITALQRFASQKLCLRHVSYPDCTSIVKDSFSRRCGLRVVFCVKSTVEAAGRAHDLAWTSRELKCDAFQQLPTFIIISVNSSWSWHPRILLVDVINAVLLPDESSPAVTNSVVQCELIPAHSYDRLC
jgi:hypothetical protein